MAQKTVLITGTSSGLGNSISRQLLANNYRVFATMREIESKNAQAAAELKQYAQEHNYALDLLELDLNDDKSIDNAVEQILSSVASIDVLINNAGVGGGGYTEAFSIEQFIQTFEVNVFGVQRMIRAVVPSMREQNSGLIINISSTMGRVVIPFSGAYTASKYALEALSETYRYELAPMGIDVAIIEPGGFASGYWDKLMLPQDSERVQGYGLVADVPDKFWSGIRTMMQGESAPDSGIIADAILNLIESPVGHRPLRTVVDPVTGGGGPTALNELSSQIQIQLLESFGFKDLLTLQSN